MTSHHLELRPMQLRWGRSGMKITTPVDYRGGPGPWQPQHALVAGIANCLRETFLILAEREHVPVLSFDARAGATMDSAEGPPQLAYIWIEPEIVTAPENTERARNAFSWALQVCHSGDILRDVLVTRPRFFSPVQESAA